MYVYIFIKLITKFYYIAFIYSLLPSTSMITFYDNAYNLPFLTKPVFRENWNDFSKTYGN